MIMRIFEGVAFVLILITGFYAYCLLNPPTKTDLTQSEALYYSLGKR